MALALWLFAHMFCKVGSFSPFLYVVPSMTSLLANRASRSLVSFSFLLTLAAVSVASSGEVHPSAPQSTQSEQDLVLKFGNRLQLKAEQNSQVLPIVDSHLRKIIEIYGNSALSKDQKNQQFSDEKQALRKELNPILTSEQQENLDYVLDHLRSDGTLGRKKPIIPLISLTFEKFFPSDALTRSIFGSSTSAIQFGLRELVEAPTQRSRFTIGFGTFNLNNSGNKLFSAGPEASYEYRIPIQRELSAFARISAGPRYMDYSFNLPSGEHDGAKSFGASGSLEAGLRYGRLQLSGAYVASTQPAGINFNGFQVDLTYVVVRF